MSTSNEPPLLSISIVNTDNKELLRKCLRTIEQSVKRTTYETFVVDNASKDGSVEMMSSEFPHVKVISNSSRRGYGDSHNRAVSIFRGKYILILNEDMEMLDDAIDVMVETAEGKNNLGALGCKILNPDLSLQISCFKFPTIAQELFEAVFPQSVVFPKSSIRSKMYGWNHDTERDVDIVVGCCMLVPRIVINHVGAFDPAFFVYSEEHDWCRRMKNAGLRVVFTPSARMIHVGGQTSKRMSLRMALVQLDSRTKYFFKHQGRTQASIFRQVAAIGYLMRGFVWGLRVAMMGGSSDGYATEKLKENLSSFRYLSTWKSQ
jgi:GT2 family glycosyltransferase